MCMDLIFRPEFLAGSFPDGFPGRIFWPDRFNMTTQIGPPRGCLALLMRFQIKALFVMEKEAGLPLSKSMLSIVF